MQNRVLTVAPRSCVLLGLCLVLVGGRVAEAADERFYVLPDGSKVPLVKSETEFGVILQPTLDPAAQKKRLESSKSGLLRDIELAPRSSLKILDVGPGSKARRKAIQEDPAVRVAGRVYRFAGSSQPVVSSRSVVFKLRPELTVKQREDLFAAYRLDRVAPFKGLHDVYVGAILDESVDDVLIAERLADDPMTLWANPNFIRIRESRQAPPPSDEFFDAQWHLENTGQTDGTPGADINARAAWDLTNGEGVLIGMLDDSCDVDHEDLSSRFIGVAQDVVGGGGCTNTCFFSFNGFCEDGGFDSIFGFCSLGTDCDDCGTREESTDVRPRAVDDRHGTAVMGLAVAAANSDGIRGVAFGARFTASRGIRDPSTDAQLATAYTFAMENGVDVHINSWGIIRFPVPIPDPPILAEAINTAFLEGRDPDGPDGEDPLGMVILFASGNQGLENKAGFELSMLPSVIGVGASTDEDKRASFSNSGRALSFLAPGTEITTTDTQDNVYPGSGYNRGGIFVFTGEQDIDPDGNYTRTFGGTSAACPIAAGVAALVLSENPNLTATDVRVLMEHSCDQINPEEAHYNGISGRSLAYGFGRINAHSAVLAARETLNNGNRGWPDVPSGVRIQGMNLSWTPGAGTSEVLVLESSLDFAFVPKDGVCYDVSQSGCADASLQPLPDGVTVLPVEVSCSGDCPTDQVQGIGFSDPGAAKKFFGLYGRSAIGRYSFGFAADSSGDFTGGGASGELPPPAVSITASPLAGQSPLTVEFAWNAVSDVGIDITKTEWDFGFEPTDGFVADPDFAAKPLDKRKPFTRQYEALAGETEFFTAVLRMTDVRGVTGQNLVRIQVSGAVSDTSGDATQLSNVKILVDAAPPPSDSRCQTTICGVSPVSMVFDLVNDSSQVPLTIDSVIWDLGDGAFSVSQSVFHTFSNAGKISVILPVTVSFTTVPDDGIPQTSSLTELITILPGAAINGDGPDPLTGTTPFGGSGGTTSPCGAIGLLPLVFCLGFVLFRRLRFVQVTWKQR